MGIKCPKCQHENPEDTLFCGKCGGPLKSAEGISVTKTIITPTTGLQKGSTVADRYKVIEELGRGGMGVVYKAEDTKLKRTVALKLLPPELTHIPEVKERFMREAQAAAALDHPNICTVYEFDEAEEKTFISMAYVEGQSLRKKLESGPLELDEALRIALQAAQGLQIAHKKGVVHRDIKSANIMVTEDNQAKIMDFGLARMTGGTLLTQEGTAMGTIAYMSPEQAQGEEVDHRTDIWSFGVVLYEMFGGQLPFMGEHDQAVVYSILNKKPKPITELRSEIPVSIGQVVDKALEKNPDKRYQQIDELLDDLKSISAGIVPEEIKSRLRKVKLQKRKRIILYAGAAVLIVIMALIARSLFTRRAEAIDSIAVLPLGNLSGDPEQEYFADGMTEELITNLAKISSLKVISRTSVMLYKGSKKPLRQIAKELNVEALIEGSVLREGGQVRITAQLIQASTDQHLWAESYQRDLRGVLALQGEIATAIADKVRAAVTPTERARLASARPVNPVAYEAYLKGMQSCYRLMPQDIDTGLEYFELALEQDPNYAPAYAGVSFAWLVRQQAGYTPPREAGPKAKAAALKAIELDSTLGEGHAALAAVNYLHDWDWAGAEVEFKRAIELNPNFQDARSMYSHYLMIMKRPEEAMVQMQRALELDPLNELVQLHYTFLLQAAGRYDEAIVQTRKLQRTSPENPGAHGGLADIFFHKAMYEESLTEMKAYYSSIGDREVEEALTQGYAQSGFRGAMRRAADVLVARFRKGYVSPEQIATLYMYAGENAQALAWLEKGLEVRDPIMPYVDLYVVFDTLHSDPRYQDLLRKMNLPVDEKE
jgi:serine/threonine protein kinase/tetratricopeptide (TPR) repeat protein